MATRRPMTREKALRQRRHWLEGEIRDVKAARTKASKAGKLTAATSLQIEIRHLRKQFDDVNLELIAEVESSRSTDRRWTVEDVVAALDEMAGEVPASVLDRMMAEWLLQRRYKLVVDEHGGLRLERSIRVVGDAG